MLGSADVQATIAVKNMAEAKEFYEGKLGLNGTTEMDGMVAIYKSGNSSLQVYVSELAGGNKATVATWMVDDIKAVTEELKGKGVSFEHYDFPGVTYDGDVHIMGESHAAWFKDPDGNILGIVNKS